MVLIQQMDNKELLTFGDLSKYLLKRIVAVTSNIIYFATDQYYKGSIKSFERARRGEMGANRMKVERRNQNRSKQWKKILTDPKNKLEFIRYFLDDWRSQFQLNHYFLNRTIFFNLESNFFKLNSNGEEVSRYFFADKSMCFAYNNIPYDISTIFRLICCQGHCQDF